MLSMQTIGLVVRFAGRARLAAGDRTGRVHRAALAALAIPLLLNACGGDSDPPAVVAVPTPGAGLAAPIVAQASPATAADGVGTPAAASPIAGSPIAATPPSGEPQTLGELADRMNAAWATVRTYRVVFVSRPAAAPRAASASPVASPAAEAPASPVAGSLASPEPLRGTARVAREVILPDRQHQRSRVEGELESASIVVGGRLYVRGEPGRALRPDLDERTWIEVDPAAIAAPTEAGRRLAALAGPIAAPTAAVATNLRPQVLRPLGEIEVAGRTCRAYAAVGTTETGERIDLTIAVGPGDLACSVETRAGGIVAVLTYETYDEALTIEAPANPAPSGPPAPATPGGRD